MAEKTPTRPKKKTSKDYKINLKVQEVGYNPSALDLYKGQTKGKRHGRPVQKSIQYGSVAFITTTNAHINGSPAAMAMLRV